MSLKVVGAGLGRTGTHSLKLALERVVGGRCYHMIEVFGRPDDIAVWERAAAGDMPVWSEFLSEYRTAVDWPVAAYWRELSAAFPEAVVLLSVRPVDDWWGSANRTIFEAMRREPPPDPVIAQQRRMAQSMFTRRFTPDWSDEEAAKAAYLRHNDEVRATVPADRLLEWSPGDGWGPICAALDRPVPDEPFPHVNTADEFRAMVGLDPPG